MSQSTPAPASVNATPLWLDILRSPAVILGSIALLVRWIIVPALNTYVRRELQAELTQLAQFPRYVERLERIERAVELLAEMPAQLGRIEERVKALHAAADE